jgi:hypothetical protein
MTWQQNSGRASKRQAFNNIKRPRRCWQTLRVAGDIGTPIRFRGTLIRVL